MFVLDSATYVVLEQINQHLQSMQGEINQIKTNINLQVVSSFFVLSLIIYEKDEQIIEKIKSALRQEISTIGN